MAEKIKQIALRMPADLYDGIYAYAKATGSNMTAWCRACLYEGTLSSITSQEGMAKSMRDALEMLEMTDEQKVYQKKQIRQIEGLISQFTELKEELAYRIYGNAPEVDEGEE